jgi:hypothetical protein
MDGTLNPAVEAAKKAADRQEHLRREMEAKRRSEEKKRKEVSDNSAERKAKSATAKSTSRNYAQQYKSKPIHQQPPSYSQANEESAPKKKFGKKQIMGLNAEFGKKKANDTSGNAGMAQNAYEARYVIPFERQPAKQVEVGYDKNLEPQDAKKQLKRRKALKVVAAYVSEAGVWGSGSGGFAGELAPEVHGNATGPISPENPKNYKLKKKTKISVPDSVVGGARITPNS